MPKRSEKCKLIDFLIEDVITDLILLEDSDSDNEDEIEDVFDDFNMNISVVMSFRNSVPNTTKYINRKRDWFSTVLPNLDENGFRDIVRVTWTQFNFVWNLIKDDEVFHGSNSCKQFQTPLQLLIVLFRLGCYGQEATVTKISNFFGVGDGGTISIITKRVFKAILKLKDTFLNWPNKNEKNDMLMKIFHELPHCVGCMDVTEIKLAEIPCRNAELYLSNKHIYSLKALTVCDYQQRFRHIELGFEGSLENCEVYSNSFLGNHITDFLSGMEWLAADSSLNSSTTILTPNSKEQNVLSKRITEYSRRTKNCVSLLKERFRSLKELKIRLKTNKSINFVRNWVTVCCILHNIILTHFVNEENFNSVQIDPDDEIDNQIYYSLPNAEGEIKKRAILNIIKNL